MQYANRRNVVHEVCGVKLGNQRAKQDCSVSQPTLSLSQPATTYSSRMLIPFLAASPVVY